jgi:hypothetical protein
LIKGWELLATKKLNEKIKDTYRNEQITKEEDKAHLFRRREWLKNHKKRINIINSQWFN